jgi:hypothetical protein
MLCKMLQRVETMSRFPPSPPNYSLYFHLVNISLRYLYLICTQHFLSQDRIALPSTRKIGFKLLLPRTHPWVVVLLCYAHALMA